MYERWENRRRQDRRIGATAALERAAVRTEPRAVVRSTLPEAMTVLPAPARHEVRLARAGAMPAAGAAGQGERGEDSDERCA